MSDRINIPTIPNANVQAVDEDAPILFDQFLAGVRDTERMTEVNIEADTQALNQANLERAAIEHFREYANQRALTFEEWVREGVREITQNPDPVQPLRGYQDAYRWIVDDHTDPDVREATQNPPHPEEVSLVFSMVCQDCGSPWLSEESPSDESTCPVCEGYSECIETTPLEDLEKIHK